MFYHCFDRDIQSWISPTFVEQYISRNNRVVALDKLVNFRDLAKHLIYISILKYTKAKFNSLQRTKVIHKHVDNSNSSPHLVISPLSIWIRWCKSRVLANPENVSIYQGPQLCYLLMNWRKIYMFCVSNLTFFDFSSLTCIEIFIFLWDICHFSKQLA